MTPEEVTKLKEEFGKKMQEQQMAKSKASGEKNSKEGAEFLAKKQDSKRRHHHGLRFTIYDHKARYGAETENQPTWSA